MFLNLNLSGGTGDCGICFSPGEFVCRECNSQITCKECCERLHQHPKRVQHKPLFIDDTSRSQTSAASATGIDNDQGIHNESFTSDDEEFPLNDSPSLNETFEHAATLAEYFSLTRFNDFLKIVIDSTLAGRDSIVVQPNGCGKSLCFQFPPNKKAIITISLMHDQVTNLSEKISNLHS